jgi:hypothetical protein
VVGRIIFELGGEGGKRRLPLPVDLARRFVTGEQGVLREMLDRLPKVRAH